ncbi:PTS transporter subunit EIIC [Nocardiopsis sediminis]|uniref:PTS transporter subunit EIIC n=1 Tax=Nocardiopsis sediminis TaxID=1778267 RepID=A0ABV8FTU9_9ACTN
MDNAGNTDKDKHQRTAADLLPLVGGAANITSVANCISRLRLGIADRSLVRDADIRAHGAVLGVVEDDTYQIVLGPGAVTKVAAAFGRLVEEGRAASAGAARTGALTGEAARLKAEQKRRNSTPGKLLLRRIANIFVPLIPALIACGIIAGITGVLTNVAAGYGLTGLAGFLPLLSAISAGFMSLIAVFVGVNAAKEFGGTPIVGGAVAAIIVYPGVTEVPFTLFGQELAPNQGGVLGAMGAAILAAYLERWATRWAPESIAMLIVPTFAVLVAGLVTLLVLMSVAGFVAQGVGVAADWLLGSAGVFAGFVLAGLFLPLVMLGLHQALIPIHTTLIEQSGYTMLLPILAMAGAGQVGAALAVYLRLKHNAAMRKTIRSALPAGLLGVGEPLIYGVSLPLGRPFITACVGGAFGGAVVGLLTQLGYTTGSTAIGPSGWALFPLTNGEQGIGFAVAVYAAGLLSGYIAGFVATYYFGFSAAMLAEHNAPPADAENEPEAAAAGAAPGTPPATAAP